MARPTKPETTTEHLGVLAAHVRGLDAVFSCGGSVELTRPVELEFRDEKTIIVARPAGDRTSTIGKRLSARCKEAPFGVGTATLYDSQVRSGRQLLAHRGGLAVYGFDLVKTGILGEVHRALCPDDPQPPVAVLYALNVYEKGGRFVTHKDTPRSADALGTLVACLPVDFSGGRLVLRHGSVRSFDWGRDDFYWGSLRGPDRVEWAAFYGDVDHEIEPVTKGTRVTLTWILKHGRRGISTRRPPETTETGLAQALEDAVADRRFMPRGGTLGVPCVHLYAETPGLTKPTPSIAGATMQRLKGRDRLFALAARSAGLRVRYRPYLYDTGAEQSWRLSRMPTKREAAIFDEHRLGESELEGTMPIERRVSHWPPTEDDVTWVVPPPWSFNRHRTAGRYAACDDPEVAAELLGELEYSGTDYFGNEGSDAAFYVAASLLLEVPSVGKRKRTGG